jgi:hypothetical protein
MARFEPGAIVETRGREWIVLPHDADDVIRLRPLTGTEARRAASWKPVETGAARPARFPPPDPASAGDATGIATLLDAARLTLRSGAAPFRGLGRISVAPRPYQLVPLLMALRLDPVRLLIADDVGVGKTVEAGLIAKELLERGVARRLAVLCPAHLGAQWVRELGEKFALPAELIQPATLARLERRLPRGDISAYAWPQALVASIDFVKTGRQKDAFLAHAPDLVIVDEAHGAARPPGGGGGPRPAAAPRVPARAHGPRPAPAPDPGHGHPAQRRRGELPLAARLLDPALEVPAGGPADRSGSSRTSSSAAGRTWRSGSAPRRRSPQRLASEETYRLGRPTPACSATCSTTAGRRWPGRPASAAPGGGCGTGRRSGSCAACSPAPPRPRACSATGRRRRARGRGRRGRRRALPPAARRRRRRRHGGQRPRADRPVRGRRRRLDDHERRRCGSSRAGRRPGRAGEDAKLARCVELVAGLLREGRRPIVFCRFIATADYLATQLQALLRRRHRDVDVRAVTGADGDEERRETVAELAASPVRVLVATDCLSEGINLQDDFDAVLHYDLPWNPNRLEQREGRSTASANPGPRWRRWCSTAPTTTSTSSCSTCWSGRRAPSARRWAWRCRSRLRPSGSSTPWSRASSCAAELAPDSTGWTWARRAR